MDFYESLAPDYDRMTRTRERFQTEEALLRAFIDPARHKNALDLACGTGLHAITLARMGLSVTAVDNSAAMLRKARANADETGSRIEWAETSMENAHPFLNRSFDAILCLGNSLPHLLTPEARQKAFEGFGRLTAPGGILLLQLLNYSRVLERRERVVAVNREGGREFVRFYDFEEKLLTFNLLTIDEQQGRLSHELRSTLLYPLEWRETLERISPLGLERPKVYGGLDRSPFDPKSSKNLVVAARRA